MDATTGKRRSYKRKIHGLTKHPLYRKWQDMKNRCYNPRVDRYKNYGGAGIIVCEEWKTDFKAFYDWSIANGWSEELTIERSNLLENYSPENCSYITSHEQHFNKKNTFYVEVDGKKISLAKIMYENNLSDQVGNVWHGMNDTGHPFSYYITKFNLTILND